MKDCEQWFTAVDEEVRALKAKGTWKIERLPPEVKEIDSRFVFALKRKADGSIDKCKARIGAKGFQERQVVILYAPVVYLASVRLALAPMGRLERVVHQSYVKSAFLNGSFERDEYLFLNPPKGLDLGLNTVYALRLNRAIYGLKRASKFWNETWNKAMTRIGFMRLNVDECFYFMKLYGCTLWLLVYVEDVLVMGLDVEVVEIVKQTMKDSFEMEDLGVAKSFLGVEFIFSEHGVTSRQEFFIQSILERFSMLECKATTTPLIVSDKQKECTATEVNESQRIGSLQGGNWRTTVCFYSHASRHRRGCRHCVTALRLSHPRSMGWSQEDHEVSKGYHETWFEVRMEEGPNDGCGRCVC